MPSSLISYQLSSGEIHVSDNDESSCTVTLKNYKGTIELSRDIQSLKLYLYGESKVESYLKLQNFDKQDKIKIDGNGSLEILGLESTSIEICSTISIQSIVCNVLYISCGNVTLIDGSENAVITCKGHAVVSDSILSYSGTKTVIQSPYLLIENSICDINSSTKWFSSDHDVIIDDCIDIESSENSFTCDALVTELNELGEEIPKEFVYALVKDESGNLVTVASRRILYGYVTTSEVIVDNTYKTIKFSTANQKGMLATDYDKFKNSTGYTNVFLHRRINQNGELYEGRGDNYITEETIDKIINGFQVTLYPELEAISKEVIDSICAGTYVYDGHPHYLEPISIDVVDQICAGTYEGRRLNGYSMDETDSRKYQLGIYSLYSYRTTKLSFHDEDSTMLEFP